MLRDQWAAAGGQAPWAGGRWGLAALAVALPVVNLACTSGAFWVITRRYGRVGFGEMGALIAAASLLNYLPMRPGLLGRVAYHRIVNGVPVWASVRVVIAVLACTGIGAGLLMASAMLVGPAAGTGATLAAIAAPGVLLAGAWAVAWAKEHPWSSYAAAALFRYVDILVWAGRYAVAFALWGQPIGLGTAAIVASITQIVTLIPLAGNGLGLREWSVGYTARWLGAAATEVGLAADLVNRFFELIGAVPLGLIGLVWLTRRMRRWGVSGTAVAADNLPSGDGAG
jgi:hypothetical protein